MLQNVNTKDMGVCVVFKPRHVTCRYVPKLKLGWGHARLLSDTIMVKLAFARAGKNSDAHY